MCISALQMKNDKEFDVKFALPAVGLGTWGGRSVDDVADAVLHALKLGYRHVDTAWIYTFAEEATGLALKKWFDANSHEDASGCDEEHADSSAEKPSRKDLIIATKLWTTYMAPEHVSLCVEQSLARLGLSYLDLLYVHWPILKPFPGAETSPANELDRPRFATNVALAETWRAMEALVAQGKVRFLGLCNVTVDMIADVLAVARIKPAAVQVELHPYLPQDELVEFCARHGIEVVAYSPLEDDTTPVLLRDPVVFAIAAKHAVETAQVLLSWSIRRGIKVIPKSTNPARLRANLHPDVPLDADDLARLATLGTKHVRYFDPRKLFGVDLFHE
ncbi:Alcohol dehydrogenase [NADP(+)] [Allomyces javanicus]|nr:Alcohol dehydrogenase [NADP(+)] [Allomyces javanicus]